MVKNLPAQAGDTGNVALIPGWKEDPLEEEMTPPLVSHWKVHREEPGRLQPMGVAESDSSNILGSV